MLLGEVRRLEDLPTGQAALPTACRFKDLPTWQAALSRACLLHSQPPCVEYAEASDSHVAGQYSSAVVNYYYSFAEVDPIFGSICTFVAKQVSYCGLEGSSGGHLHDHLLGEFLHLDVLGAAISCS